LDQLHLENLRGVFADLGISACDLPENTLQDLNRAWEHLPGWQDSSSGLERLRSRYIIGPLSNGNTALLVNMAKNAHLAWDVIIGLDLLRTFKPKPEAYLGAANLLRLRPGEVMLAAAHNYDLQGARDAGLATAFILRDTEHGPNQTTDLTPSSDWDISVTDLMELATALHA
jgi:2-haloacid dehalogenase